MIAALAVSGNAALNAGEPLGTIMTIVALAWPLIELIVKWRHIEDSRNGG